MVIATSNVTATQDRTIGTAGALATRRLILRDSLAIFTLAATTVVLFAVTLLLFNSFSAHRQELARRWSERGAEALRNGQPDAAVVSLRTALSYAPGERAYELLLAQALGEAGHTEESYNYFMGLWETEPGDGFTNLELARLAAKRKDPRAAVNYYRASLYGTWEGDGVVKRSAVRLELARYLIAIHNLPAARLELLVAGGNTPDDPDRDITLGDLLLQAGDPANAAIFYQKALVLRPSDVAALEAAGRIAYQSGDFAAARQLLARSLQARPMETRPEQTPERPDGTATMEANSARVLELTPSPGLPLHERIARILTIRDIAEKRFDSCTAEVNPAPDSALAQLGARWEEPVTRRVLTEDPDRQDAVLALAYETERETAKLCASATGDDAAVALMAKFATPAATAEMTKPDDTPGPPPAPKPSTTIAKQHWWQRGAPPPKPAAAPQNAPAGGGK
jgi:tetratricopeptide (TPR) repeat protein